MDRSVPIKLWRISAPLFFLSSLVPQICEARLEPLSGRVTDVRVDRGEVRVALTSQDGVQIGDRGQIQSRSGPVDIRVIGIDSPGEVRAREERRGGIEPVRSGDTVILFPSAARVEEEAAKSLTNLDRLLTREQAGPLEALELAPDFLAEVTGTTLEDYEMWVQILESEPLESIGELEVPLIGPKEALPVYPDIATYQTIQTGVDYDRFVFNATQTETAGEVVREQIGRFFRWNYVQSGDVWKDRFLRFENEFEANEIFLFEEMDFRRDYEFANGDRFWWENRAIWKVFLNEQGDPFVLDDFETRYVRKLSEKWGWQTGLIAQHKREYNTDSDDGYSRMTLLSEWNYRDGFERWFDVAYEFTREVRNDPERDEQDYWEHLIETQFFQFEEDWSLDLFGEFFYRDYNQPNDEQDVYNGLVIGTGRRKLSDRWTLGLRNTVEPRYYPTTEDVNTNAIRAEAAPFVEYKRDGKLFVTAEPRVSQVFHFGEVSDNIILGPGVPRDKSDGDYREAGISLSASWFPNDQWRLSLYQDTYRRWFPHGETGESAFYLFDFPRIADSVNFFGSLSVDYLCSEDLELSFRVSHTRQVYDTFDENDTESLNIGVEATYRF
jgi:hypothetical protein